MAATDRLNVARCAATSAAVLSAILVLCWLGAALIGPMGSHMYVSMFTTAMPWTPIALIIGLCWSVVLGAVSGGLFAVFYNWFGRWERS